MMKKLLVLLMFATISISYGQHGRFWNPTNLEPVELASGVSRGSFPIEFEKVQIVNAASYFQLLSEAQDRSNTSAVGVVIELPSANGGVDSYRVYEASNFEPALQERYPNIRSYVGIGIDNAANQVRFSVDPSGIKSMAFKADGSVEFIEPYGANGEVYAVYKSTADRAVGELPFECTTEEHTLTEDLMTTNSIQSVQTSDAELLTFRLALSCNGQYANYFGATSPAEEDLVLAAFNATMTRVNGVFERDFAIHLNIIEDTTEVIYYNSFTDPYSNMNNWNTELQNTLTSQLGNEAYDIGHMFGGSGGGGNAGCIGCICVDDTASTFDQNKGAGITSPSDGIPEGDTFDIDYVAHEMGHQLGATHTFSYNNEGSGTNMEVGSGSTIMGYAGITGFYDVQSHSDDYFHAVSIQQVQQNMTTKSCYTLTELTHTAPVVDAGENYTIPRLTPFMLTGSATDDSGNEGLTYCWEQYDNATGAFTGSNSLAFVAKSNGPNWKSFTPSVDSVRVFPRMESVLAGETVSYGTGSGSDNIVEALNYTGRTLNFRLTVRDNQVDGGLTNYDNVTLTVSQFYGPLTVTSQSFTQLLGIGQTETITWNVNNTSSIAGGENVDILLSVDGGENFDIVLAENVPNDGSEEIIIPDVTSQTCRIMVKASDNIFFNVNAEEFSIGEAINIDCDSYTNSNALQIPDSDVPNGPGETVSSFIDVDTGDDIDIMKATLNITHGYIKDLYVVLKSPEGTEVVIWDRDCANEDGINVVFQDDAAVIPNDCDNPFLGIYAPAESFAAFTGESPVGEWELMVTDYSSFYTGQVDDWSLDFCSEDTASSRDFSSLADFDVYPNPNNGEFTVSLSNAKATMDVDLTIYDVQGRTVLSKSYDNTGAMTDTVNLGNVAPGVYLVTVTTGDALETKKIIIQ